jgi:hypothetical protein
MPRLNHLEMVEDTSRRFSQFHIWHFSYRFRGPLQISEEGSPAWVHSSPFAARYSHTSQSSETKTSGEDLRHLQRSRVRTRTIPPPSWHGPCLSLLLRILTGQGLALLHGVMCRTLSLALEANWWARFTVDHEAAKKL